MPRPLVEFDWGSQSTRRVFKLAAASEVLHSIAVCEQPVVANALETGGDDVEQKAAQELVGRQRHLT